MQVHFKFTESIAESQRAEILRSLDRAGYHAEPVFPNQTRPSLSTIQRVIASKATDLATIRSLLSPFKGAIDYVERVASRRMK